MSDEQVKNSFVQPTMIVDKHKKPDEDEIINTPDPPTDDDTTVEEVDDNPIINVYKAVRRVLESLRVNPNDNTSEQLFKTIKIDNGQFERIVRSKGNTEYAVAFPAAFIRFVNVRFLVAQQRIGEGRATMRIRFVLNNLNNSDDDVECEGFDVFQRINDAIQDAKDVEPALNERCNLTYFDMPESLDNGLQPYWIDYEIWFRTSSSFQYRNWVERYIVIPPFTNHSDAPEHDNDHHGDHNEPTFDDVAHFEPRVDVDTDDGDKDDNTGDSGEDNSEDTDGDSDE